MKQWNDGFFVCFILFDLPVSLLWISWTAFKFSFCLLTSRQLSPQLHMSQNQRFILQIFVFLFVPASLCFSEFWATRWSFGPFSGSGKWRVPPTSSWPAWQWPIFCSASSVYPSRLVAELWKFFSKLRIYIHVFLTDGVALIFSYHQDSNTHK